MPVRLPLWSRLTILTQEMYFLHWRPTFPFSPAPHSLALWVVWGWSLPWGMEGTPSGPHQVQIGLFLI